MVALDDADATERFGKAAGDLGVDLGALTEDGADGLEGTLENKSKDHQDDKGDERHLHAELDEVDKGEDGGEQAAEEVDNAGADEVADAFDVGHDAGDEGAGTVGVVEGYGETAYVDLDLHAQLGDEALAGFGEKLRERERSDSLNDRGKDDDADDDGQQAKLMLAHNVIDEVAGGSRQDETASAVDDHQKEAACEENPAGRMSFQTSGRTFLSLGLGREAVRSAVWARPVLREGRSAALMLWDPPKFEEPKEDID